MTATALRAHLVVPASKKEILNSDQASPNDWNYLWGGGEVVFSFFVFFFLQSLLAWLPSIKKSVNLFFFVNHSQRHLKALCTIRRKATGPSRANWEWPGKTFMLEVSGSSGAVLVLLV